MFYHTAVNMKLGIKAILHMVTGVVDKMYNNDFVCRAWWQGQD